MDEQKLKELRKKYIFKLKLFIGSFFFDIAALYLYVILFNMFYGEPSAIINYIFFTVLSFITFAAGLSFSSERIKYLKIYKKTVLPNTIKNMLIDGVYKEENKEILDYVEGRVIKKGNEREADDYIKGKYKDLSIEVSEFKITYESTDADGDTHVATFFRGPWFIFDFNKSFKYNLVVYHKNNSSIINFGEEIFSEDVEFNDMFKVMATNKQEAFYILTPQMIEKIKELYKKFPSKLIVYFDNNKLHIGLNGYKNLFEPKTSKNFDIETYKKNITEDFNNIVALAESVKSNNDLFKK